MAVKVITSYGATRFIFPVATMMSSRITEQSDGTGSLTNAVRELVAESSAGAVRGNSRDLRRRTVGRILMSNADVLSEWELHGREKGSSGDNSAAHEKWESADARRRRARDELRAGSESIPRPLYYVRLALLGAYPVDGGFHGLPLTEHHRLPPCNHGAATSPPTKPPDVLSSGVSDVDPPRLRQRRFSILVPWSIRTQMRNIKSSCCD